MKTMKVLMINGSPKAKGNTAMALEEMKKIFEDEGVEVKLVHIGQKAVRGCIDCGRCRELKRCVFDDVVNETQQDFAECDGLVVGAPVYYASANATLIAYLTRLFFSYPGDKRMKVGAGVTVARRGGCSAAFDEVNKFFAISGMPIATSHYWNMVYGAKPGEAAEDAEGLQTVRSLARNMTFLMKGIALAKEAYGLPETEPRVFTNFVR